MVKKGGDNKQEREATILEVDIEPPPPKSMSRSLALAKQVWKSDLTLAENTLPFLMNSRRNLANM